MCTPLRAHLPSTTAILTLTGSTHHLPYRGGGGVVEKGVGEGETPGKAASLGTSRAASAESGTATRRRRGGKEEKGKEGRTGGEERDHGPTERGANDERVEGGEESGKAAGRREDSGFISEID